MAFDGIVTKAIASELQELSGARIDKIFQPNKNTIILGFYLGGTNYALNICIDSQNYRINLTTHAKPNPKVAPNFCMLLRKHLIGLHLKNVITQDLERVVTIEFEGFDDIDDIIEKKLIIELMGKHCNIILLDDKNYIIDSLRHIVPNNSTHSGNDSADIDYAETQLTRNLIPHVKYVYPAILKENFLELSDFSEFKEKLGLADNLVDNIELLPTTISNTFNGISRLFISSLISTISTNNGLDDTILEKIHSAILEIIHATDNTSRLCFKTVSVNSQRRNENANQSQKQSQGQGPRHNQKQDYVLSISHQENQNTAFGLNFFINDWYDEKESSEDFKIYRNSILKLILDTLKKYNSRLAHINQKLSDCEDMERYRIYGELITANLYRIKEKNIDEITLENYYDKNKPITISLDKKYSPSINAQRFFKKYNKLKNALEIVSLQKEETLKELNYIESIVYELETCNTLEEVSEIFEEISENVIFKDKTSHLNKKKSSKIKKSSLTKNKTVSFNPIKYKIDNYTLLVGRNNKENDYLTMKYAKKEDIWFHTKDFHGSHAILQTNNLVPSDDVILKCAQIAAYHSKARNSSHVPVDFCQVKFVKKPNGAKPGMVIYTNNRTLEVTPDKK